MKLLIVVVIIALTVCALYGGVRTARSFRASLATRSLRID